MVIPAHQFYDREIEDHYPQQKQYPAPDFYRISHVKNPEQTWCRSGSQNKKQRKKKQNDTDTDISDRSLFLPLSECEYFPPAPEPVVVEPASIWTPLPLPAR